MKIKSYLKQPKIQIPAKALFNIEHEREGNTEEVEFQFKWERWSEALRPTRQKKIMIKKIMNMDYDSQ